jgi:hypothetical protein
MVHRLDEAAKGPKTGRSPHRPTAGEEMVRLSVMAHFGRSMFGDVSIREACALLPLQALDESGAN